MTVLGVTFTHILSFVPHVLKVTGNAAASLYALKTLETGRKLRIIPPNAPAKGVLGVG